MALHSHNLQKIHRAAVTGPRFEPKFTNGTWVILDHARVEHERMPTWRTALALSDARNSRKLRA